MSIGDRIKEARIREGLTQEELAIRIGATKGAIANYENKVSIPKPELMFKLINVLKCDANYLYQDEMSELTDEFIVSFGEIDHIKKYRSLDQIDRQAVDGLLDTLSKRSKEFIVLQPPIVVPYYGHIASAGTGQYVFDDIPPEMIEIENNIDNMHVDFAIGVNGDSMEPTYNDGDTLLIKKQQNVDIGEIGIFMIDGDAFVKELGSGTLISHNKKYDDIYITEETLCVGKVLGKI